MKSGCRHIGYDSDSRRPAEQVVALPAEQVVALVASLAVTRRRKVYRLVSLEVSPGNGWRSLTVALGGAPVATVSG